MVFKKGIISSFLFKTTNKAHYNAVDRVQSLESTDIKGVSVIYEVEEMQNN